MARVLLVGESWTIHLTHVKGFDSFTTSEYAEGGTEWMALLLSAGHEVDYIPAHKAPTDFPRSVEEFSRWDVIALSDIGANSLAITLDVWKGGRALNPLEALGEWVEGGGGVVMCGGYLSFSGFEAKACFAGTAVERVLPVTISRTDDRIENPRANVPITVATEHRTMRGVPAQWPEIMGYNQLTAKPDADVLATVGADPFVVSWQFGRGRALAFATDIGPHWAPADFVASQAYRAFWPNAIEWLAGQDES
jgi:uncharacterized membrane protein